MNVATVDRIPTAQDLPWQAATARIRILSDLHLGHPASLLHDPRTLTPALEGADVVLFNGDTAELAHQRRRGPATAALAVLDDHCRSLGARPFFLPGNHDPAASSLQYVDLAGGAIFVTHGDVLHPLVAPWSRDVAELRRQRQRWLAEPPAASWPPGTAPETLDGAICLARLMAAECWRHDPDLGRGMAARLRLVARFARQPWRIPKVLWFWWRTVAYVRSLRDRYRPQARSVLIGHTHQPRVSRQRDLTVINTGSFLPLSYPLLVEVVGTRWRTARLRWHGGSWVPTWRDPPAGQE